MTRGSDHRFPVARATRRGFLGFCLAAGVGGDVARAAPPWTVGPRAPGWSAASGQHYDPGPAVEGRPIYRLVRAPAFHDQAGLARDVTDRPPAERPADVTAVEGPFSGETRYYDFGSVDREGSFAAKVANNTRNRRDALMLVDSGSIPRLRANPALFKDAVYAAATFFATGEFVDDPVTNWQVGNEPNDISYFNPRGVDLGDDESVWDYFNDDRQADLYVDLFLGPAVAALRRAEADLPAGSSPFTVMPGGIGLINVDGSHDWLERVLERRPSRARAPELADAPMKDHLDVVAVHYAFVPPFDDADYDYSWRETLTRLTERWIETGAVDGIWHTEEGGYGSWGASHLAFATPRFLNWWAGRGWTPDSARLVWWPTPDGPDSDSYAAQRLQRALVDLWNGRRHLVDVSGRLAVAGNPAPDEFAFTAPSSALRLGAFVGPGSSAGADGSSRAPAFSSVRLAGDFSAFDPGAHAAAARVVRPGSLRPVDVELTVESTPTPAIRVRHPRVALEPFETLVVCVAPASDPPFRDAGSG